MGADGCRGRLRLMRCCVLIRRKRAPMALKKRVGGASGVSRMVRILSRMRVISGSRSSMPPACVKRRWSWGVRELE